MGPQYEHANPSQNLTKNNYSKYCISKYEVNKVVLIKIKQA